MTIIAFFIDEWKEFAQKHNGKIVYSKTGTSPTGFGMSSWKKVYLKIPYENSEIVFETGEATRMQLYFGFKTDLGKSFLIYPEDYMDKVSKYLKLLKEIEIGDAEFDKRFIIKTNNESFINKMLNEEIKDFLIKYVDRISNYKLEKVKGSSILQFNAPFSENNNVFMERVLSFMKLSVDQIISNV